jgi:diketogulonate reductase-like aldo/keto reductase
MISGASKVVLSCPTPGPALTAVSWIPIPGTRRRARLKENAMTVYSPLSTADLERLEAAVPHQAWYCERQAFAAYGTTRSVA